MRISIIVLLFFVSKLYSQENRWQLQADYFYGNIIEHRSSIKHLIKNHPSGTLLSFQKRTIGESIFEEIYNYPSYGLSFHYEDMKTESLGEHFGLYGHYEFYFLNRNLSLRIAQGINYNTNPYHKHTNYRNIAYGTHFMPATYISLQYRHENIFKGIGLHTGVSFFHHSNARMKAPNTSTNTLSITFGINYNFNEIPDELFIKRDSIDEFSEPIKFQISARSGFNSSEVVGTKSYPFYVFTAYADKRIGRKSGLLFGADVFVMPSIKEHIKYLMVAYPERNLKEVDYKKIGLVFGHELFIDKIAVETQVGAYVYAPFNENDALYQRLALKYYITPNVFTSVNLKTHMAKAEALEFAFGVRL